jgi:hypothetical protein
MLAGKRTAAAPSWARPASRQQTASAVLAATGIAVTRAPIIVPLVTMAAAGVVVTRASTACSANRPAVRGLK